MMAEETDDHAVENAEGKFGTTVDDRYRSKFRDRRYRSKFQGSRAGSNPDDYDIPFREATENWGVVFFVFPFLSLEIHNADLMLAQVRLRDEMKKMKRMYR
jgi:hypothetical protein